MQLKTEIKLFFLKSQCGNYSSVTTKQGYGSTLLVQGVTWVRRRCFRTKTDWTKLIFLYFLKAACCHLGISLCSSFIGSSVQFSCSVISDSLWPHGLQHSRPPCPSPTPRACLNSCPLSQWCYPTISSSVIPFSSCPQSSPASGSFPMSQFFTSGSQSIGVSTSTSVLPVNTQDWPPVGWTAWISL